MFARTQPDRGNTCIRGRFPTTIRIAGSPVTGDRGWKGGGGRGLGEEGDGEEGVRIVTPRDERWSRAIEVLKSSQIEYVIRSLRLFRDNQIRRRSGEFIRALPARRSITRGKLNEFYLLIIYIYIYPFCITKTRKCNREFKRNIKMRN